MSKADDIAAAKAVADELRDLWPEKAAAIDTAIAELEEGRRDSLKIDVSVRYRLEKFIGTPGPDSVPFEVIEGVG
jgi:hypothetical protein